MSRRALKHKSSLMSEAPKLDPREQHFRLPGNRQGFNIFLRYLSSNRNTGAERVVCYVHGATFPLAFSIAHRFDDGFSFAAPL